jgi:hypothetical protein
MVEPTELSRRQLRHNPHAIWNTFVELLGHTEPGTLSVHQQLYRMA